ncbi:MAG: M48 family metallopeptidase [Treponema sp.]|nr:M48 family metallopeptidase [Treponema sp.]
MRRATCLLAAIALCVQSVVYSDGLDVLRRVNGDTIIKAGKGIEAASTSIANITEEITPEQQYYIGRAVAGTVLEKYKLYQNKEATAYANKICAAITQASDMPQLYKGYYVGILDSSEANAISTPGGHILITRGLLECARDEDALAAVIAHEIAHIQLGHSVKAIKSNRATSEFVKAVQSGSSGNDALLLDGFKDCVNDVVDQVVTSGYSKSQEFQADKKALSLMSDAGYDPAAMQDMLNLLKLTESEQAGGFSKTHPSAESRIKNIKGDLKKYKKDYNRKVRQARFAKAQGSLQR